jgi:hypothetical protein
MEDKTAHPGSRILPDEQFWKRYSPHGEMPISTVGSVALHALAVGLLLLLGAYLARLIAPTARSLPVEAVRVAGPGGGQPDRADADGLNLGADNIPEVRRGSPDGAKDGSSPQRLSKPQPKEVKHKFPDGGREILSGTPNTTGPWTTFDKELKNKLNKVPRGQPDGGPKGGVGNRPGTGGPGPGGGPRLTRRQQRMLRWHMHFPIRSTEDYLRQLHDLGAILGIPYVKGDRLQYKLIRNLVARPARLLDEDAEKLGRISWKDRDPGSVDDVMRVLGVRMRPDHFVAFMPVQLENQLFEMERRYFVKNHGTFDEDRIDETRFDVVRGAGGKLTPVLRSMTLKDDDK